VIGQAQRQPQPGYFETIGAALTQRKQIELSYLARGTNQASLRTLCPQRLVHYRDHWYLDAWCHLRQSLRTFALDSVQAVKVLKHPAQDHNEAELDAHFSSGYGIFAGPPTQTAQLRFSPERAQWVRDEQWHPDQTSTANPDGSYDLHIPYSDPRELFMDIMKHGAHCDVLAPEELRLMVKSELVRMGNKYFLAGNESRRI
jgi:predicted DNA-binding transcriptional regulator YafY